MNYIVISDLHIGGDTSVDIFHSQRQLADFLDFLTDKPQILIINGDFIDFLCVEPYSMFSRKAATQKIEKIVSAPPNQDIWKSFRAFLHAHPQNRVEILLGNHDVELVFEEVQNALKAVMAEPNEGDRIGFIIDRLSYPRLQVGGVHIHIEHGFQYDVFNWYDHTKLIKAVEHAQDGTHFTLPMGSRLVYEVLNRLTPSHPFLPLLKPETAAFWLMVALAPKEVFKHLGITTRLTKESFMTALRKYRKGIQLGAPEEASIAETQSSLTSLESQLALMLFEKELSAETVEDVEEFLNNGTGDERPAGRLTFAASPILRGKLFFVRRALKSLKYERDTFFDSTQRDEFEDGLGGILAEGAKIALFGHSHGRKMLTLFGKESTPGTDLLHQNRPSLVYVNTGTWANLLDFDLEVLSDDEKAQQWLDDLESGSFQPTLIYTYARLEEVPSGGARVSLEEWRDGKPHEIEKQGVSP